MKTRRRQKGRGCAGSKCPKDPRQTQIEFLQDQLLVIRDKTQREKIKTQIRTLESAIQLAKIEERFAKDIKSATKALSSIPSKGEIKKTVVQFEKASAAVEAAKNAFIKGSASTAGVSESEIEKYTKGLKATYAAELRASMPKVSTHSVVRGGRLKSRRRK